MRLMYTHAQTGIVLIAFDSSGRVTYRNGRAFLKHRHNRHKLVLNRLSTLKVHKFTFVGLEQFDRLSMSSSASEKDLRSLDEDSGHDSIDDAYGSPAEDRERIEHLETVVTWIRREVVSRYLCGKNQCVVLLTT